MLALENANYCQTYKCSCHTRRGETGTCGRVRCIGRCRRSGCIGIIAVIVRIIGTVKLFTCNDVLAKA